MNGQDLLESLIELMDEHEVSLKEFAWGDFEGAFEDLVTKQLGPFEMVMEAQRTEGDGDYDGAQAVYHFSAHDVYISVEGWYGSEAGYNFDEGLDVVEPIEVTTTIYRHKKEV